MQDAFCGLYRRWRHLASTDKALSYVRSSVLNGCRSALRKDRARPAEVAITDDQTISRAAVSAEAAVLSGEDRREVIAALRQLPGRQREVLVLRYYLDLTDDQIARDMGISRSTIRSTRYRALTALGQLLRETAP